MKRRGPWAALLMIVVVVALSLGTVSATSVGGPLLVSVTLRSGPEYSLGPEYPLGLDLAQVEAAGVPVYARLLGEGPTRLLVGANARTLADLRARGLQVEVLDVDTEGAAYFLVGARQPDGLSLLSQRVRVMTSDGVQALVRLDTVDETVLLGEGLDHVALTLEPITLWPRGPAVLSSAVEADPRVATMIAQVDPARLDQYSRWLTGEEPVDIGGEPYTITTRHTHSGPPLQKATQYTYDHLAGLGLEVEVHPWREATPPNVLAMLPGLTHPDQVYLLSAHLDDMPTGPLAPGADDNASGVAAVLMIADILSQYDFGCTLRFALWTGEEQGLLGSDAWAAWAAGQGMQIQGVLNLDMIAYDAVPPPVIDLHARSWLTESVTMAHLFANVVEGYELDLVPEVLVDNYLGDYSDNRSFWDEGYAAILAIEDNDDFTPYYHTPDDRLATLNMAYFAEFVKAALATFVHTADCLIEEGPDPAASKIFLPVIVRE
jgi:hypothetical protein